METKGLFHLEPKQGEGKHITIATVHFLQPCSSRDQADGESQACQL